MNSLAEPLSERRQLLGMAALLMGAFTAIAAAAAFFLFAYHRVGVLGGLGVILLGPLAGALAASLIWHGSGAVSRGFVRYVTAARGLPHRPEYSLQESLVARGRLPEAVESWRTYLAEHPGDLDARLAFAALHVRQLRDAAAGERMYLEVRRLSPSPRQELAIGNALIDLYHATGQHGRELAELARFADRFRGTREGERAREALARLKAERG
jgi:hypothetical protein